MRAVFIFTLGLVAASPPPPATLRPPPCGAIDLLVLINERSPKARQLYRQSWLQWLQPARPRVRKTPVGTVDYRFFVQTDLPPPDHSQGDVVILRPTSTGFSRSAIDSLRIQQMRWAIERVEFRYLLLLELGESRPLPAESPFPPTPPSKVPGQGGKSKDPGHVQVARAAVAFSKQATSVAATVSGRSGGVSSVNAASEPRWTNGYAMVCL